jgi:hypothetical protein
MGSFKRVVEGICDSEKIEKIDKLTAVPRTALEPTQPPIQWVPGALSLSSSAEVKNAWSYTSTPQYILMAWCLVQHRDNFTFTFIFN